MARAWPHAEVTSRESNMTPERRQQVQQLFEAALATEPAKRPALLDSACQGEPELRVEVERLLAENEVTRSSTEKPSLPQTGPRSLEPTTFSRGDLVSDRYLIVRFVAKGGMGEVYEAQDLELETTVALKTLLPETGRSEFLISRFKREIQLARQVTHPNVCRVFDLGRCQHAPHGDVPYLTMEFLSGETLARRIARAGPFSTGEARPLIHQMASALSAAHNLGIIHRDFKSSNVMLVPILGGECVKVTDFGLARSVGDNSKEFGDLSATGQAMGTPPYMAPEQYRGQASEASDIYALGVVMHEMITGERPSNSGSGPSPRAPIRHIHPRWEAAIRKCLQPDPADRFPRVENVVAALGEDTERETEAIALLPRSRLAAAVRRARRFVVFVLLGLLMLAGVSLVVWTLGRHRPPAAAIRWYDEGTRALRDGTYYTAMRALERAVELDGAFTLAHASLAEAATELDYTDKAKSELLRASPPAFAMLFLSPFERWRLQAIYLFVTRDFAQAAAKYKELERWASAGHKAGALLDLGRALESNGDIQGALDSYSESLKRDRQYAAAFLRRGILYGRQQATKNAAADFDQAEALYRTEGKTEGLTEVLYQRGVMLYGTGNMTLAQPMLEKALQMARTSGNEYQQVRALLELSNMSYMGADAAAGQKQAEQAIALARSAGIEVLATSGLVDLGTALYLKGDYAAAEPYLRNALELAKRYAALRVEARAAVSLGGMLLNEGRTDEGLALTRQALEFYQRAGYRTKAARTLIPIGRALTDKGDYEAAGNLFRQQLQLASQVNDSLGIGLADDGLGLVFLLKENYPAALQSFDRSLLAYRSLPDQLGIGYSQLSRGSVLWQLGRYRDANQALDEAAAVAAKLGGNKPLMAEIYETRAELAWSQRRSRQVDEYGRQALEAGGQDPRIVADVKRLMALSRIFSGRVEEGKTLCAESLDLARKTGSVPLLQRIELALAEGRLADGDVAGSLSLAEELAKAFEQKGQTDSELQALDLGLRTSRERSARQRFAEAAKASMEKLRQNWGPQAYEAYLSRPDIQKLRNRTNALR